MARRAHVVRLEHWSLRHHVLYLLVAQLLVQQASDACPVRHTQLTVVQNGLIVEAVTRREFLPLHCLIEAGLATRVVHHVAAHQVRDKISFLMGLFQGRRLSSVLRWLVEVKQRVVIAEIPIRRLFNDEFLFNFKFFLLA